MKRITVIVIFFCLSFSVQSFSQKVGLVLSGGGAKGFAHLGVIRALEESGIPIDYIAGSSMGAIVGGLYAAGFSVDEMDSLFRSDQFKFWSTGKIQEEYRYYFKKLEDDPSWLELELKKKEDKIKILPPTNLIPEEQMDFAFMELFASSNAVCQNDFSKLFVPFFCVVSDVHNSRDMTLQNGDLGEAIRGSMTFPLYFKPIRINGNLVFDGGIFDNFPIEKMKAIFKPDVIIGHNVSSNAEEPDEDDVVTQLENLIMQKTNYSIPSEDGVLMETRFSNVGLLDFKKIDLIEEGGYQTAKTFLDSISKRVQRRVDLKEVEDRRRRFNLKKPELLFANVQVEGVTDHMQRKFIIQSLKHQSRVVNLEELKKEYFKLVADQQIKSIRPIADFDDKTGYFDLHLKVKTDNPVQIKFGGNVSSRPVNQGFLSLDYRTFKDRSYTLSTNMYFGRFYSSFKAGARFDFPTTIPFYLAGYATFNRWDYYSTSTEFVFEDVRPPYIIQDENNVKLEMGFPVKVNGKLTFCAAYSNAVDEYYLTESVKKGDDPDQTTFDAFVLGTCLEANSLNYKQHATEGLFSSLSVKYVMGEEINQPGTTSNTSLRGEFSQSYYLLIGKYDRYFKLGSHFTLGVMAEGVYSNKKPFSNYVATVLAAPSFTPFPHSKTFYLNNFHANKYLASGIKGILNISDQLHIRAEAYAFSPVNNILEASDHMAVYDSHTFSTVRFMGLGAIVLHTSVGPVSLSLNYYDKGGTRLYAMINFGYILFNKRAY